MVPEFSSSTVRNVVYVYGLPDAGAMAATAGERGGQGGSEQRQSSDGAFGLGEEYSRDIAEAAATVGATLRDSAANAQESIEALGGVLERLGSRAWKALTQGTGRSQLEEVRAMAAGQSELVRGVQTNSATFCQAPEDGEGFEQFRQAVMQEREGLEELESAAEEVKAKSVYMAELEQRLVPKVVDWEAFWLRYFFRLHQASSGH